MNKIALLLLFLALANPLSVSAGSISYSEQAEQTETIFEVLSKPRQQNSILAIRTSVQKSKAVIWTDSVKLVFGVSSRSAKNNTPIYLRQCTLLI